MIFARFRIVSRPERFDELAAAMQAVEAPSRELTGVLHFDIVRSLSEPDALLAYEIFETRDAFVAQNALPEVAALLSLVSAGATIGGYEFATWET